MRCVLFRCLFENLDKISSNLLYLTTLDILYNKNILFTKLYIYFNTFNKNSVGIIFMTNEFLE